MVYTGWYTGRLPTQGVPGGYIQGGIPAYTPPEYTGRYIPGWYTGIYTGRYIPGWYSLLPYPGGTVCSHTRVGEWHIPGWGEWHIPGCGRMGHLPGCGRMGHLPGWEREGYTGWERGIYPGGREGYTRAYLREGRDHAANRASLFSQRMLKGGS